jgi:glycogen(starch) synthase
MKSIEDSVNQLTDQMVSFCQKTRRQRINQRNRTERLSDLLDWKRMGLEYAKARQLALRRAYPDSFDEDDFSFEDGQQRIPRPMSAPASPRFTSGLMTPGDVATLTEEMQGLGTSDYMGNRFWQSVNQTQEDEDAGYFPPLVLKRRSSTASTSGFTTPGGTGTNGKGRILSEGDLEAADAALNHRKHESLSPPHIARCRTDRCSLLVDSGNEPNGY